MTPLTHAAVGTVIVQQLRKRRNESSAWIIGLPLAFASHYALDQIPHFEGVVPYSGYKSSLALMVFIGLVGTALALLLMRTNREAGRIWLVLFLWIGIGSYSLSYLRIVTAGLALAYVAWSTGSATGPGYLLGGMVSVAPDLIPNSVSYMARLHFYAHSHLDFPAYLYTSFRKRRAIWGVGPRLHDPYFLLGYALEILVEGIVFFGSMYLFFRKPSHLPPPPQPPPIQHTEIMQPLELARKS